VCCGATEKEFTRRAAAIGQDPASLRANSLGGLPGEIIERIGAFGVAGAQTVYLQVLDLGDHDHLRLIASEVAAHV
jgi:hypothetical protein